MFFLLFVAPSPSANSMQTPHTSYFTMMQNGGTVLNGIPNQMTGMPIQQQQISTTNNPFSSFNQPSSISQQQQQQQIFTHNTSSPFTSNNMIQQPQLPQQQQPPFNQFPNFTQQQITRSSFF